MKPAFVTAMLALVAQGPALGADQTGRIDTLERGYYACELPGDASTMRGLRVPEEDFTVTNGSSYSADGQAGTYLRTGDTVAMTSGPRKGNRYAIKSGRFLRKLDDKGEPSALRCVRQGATQG